MSKAEISDILNEVSKTSWSMEPPNFCSQFFTANKFRLFNSGMSLKKFKKFIDENECLFSTMDWRTLTIHQFMKTFSLTVIDLVLHIGKNNHKDFDYVVLFVPRKYMDAIKNTGIKTYAHLLVDSSTCMIAIKSDDLMVRNDSLIPREEPAFVSQFLSKEKPEYYIEMRGHKAPKQEKELDLEGVNYYYNMPQNLLEGKLLMTALTNITGQMMGTVIDDHDFKFNKVIVVISSKALDDIDNSRFYPLYSINKGRCTVIGLDYHDLMFKG